MSLNITPKLGTRAGMLAKHKGELVLKITQRYLVQCWADASRRKLLWEKLVDNLVTTEGQNKYLDATLVSGLTTPAWYIGLVDNSGFTAYAAGDTAAKINTVANPPTTNGWQEVTAYSESVRQTWTPGAVSSASVSNVLSAAAFSINATKTVRGSFMVSSSTKGGTGGVLLGEADFGSAQPLISGNTLTVTVTCLFTTC